MVILLTAFFGKIIEIPLYLVTLQITLHNFMTLKEQNRYCTQCNSNTIKGLQKPLNQLIVTVSVIYFNVFSCRLLYFASTD